MNITQKNFFYDKKTMVKLSKLNMCSIFRRVFNKINLLLFLLSCPNHNINYIN